MLEYAEYLQIASGRTSVRPYEKIRSIGLISFSFPLVEDMARYATSSVSVTGS
jgi:hypothetical protein